MILCLSCRSKQSRHDQVDPSDSEYCAVIGPQTWWHQNKQKTKNQVDPSLGFQSSFGKTTALYGQSLLDCVISESTCISSSSQTRLMSWYRKWKLIWRKDLITYNSYPWIMFSFNLLFFIWRGRGFIWNWTSKVNFGKILDIDGQGGGGLENWTIFMDVICVSSLIKESLS